LWTSSERKKTRDRQAFGAPGSLQGEPARRAVSHELDVPCRAKPRRVNAMWTDALMPMLETERLIIRPCKMDDLEVCHRLYLDIGWPDRKASDFENRERKRKWLEWTVRNYEELARLQQPPYGERAVELKNTNQFAGLVGLVPMLKPFAHLACFGGLSPESAPFSAEIGLFWAITPTLQRRGIATEAARAVITYAFGTLRLGRILAGTEYANISSIGVMRRLGMRIERNQHSVPEWFQVHGVLERSNRAPGTAPQS
jgi:RimJ/RimL family protein N-acetyltransferase